MIKGAKMNSRTLIDVRSDLDKFYQIIVDIKEHRPLTYDKFLKIPAWRGETEHQGKVTKRGKQVEDYADAILAFSSHVAMLQTPTQAALSGSTNKNDLVEISKRFSQYVDIYASFTKSIKNKAFCRNLSTDLHNINQIIQKFTLDLNQSKGPPT
jgi:hypothetical protein